DLAQLEGEAQRIERRPPDLPVREGTAEDDQRFGLLVARGRALVGYVGGGGGALGQRGALLLARRPDLADRAGQLEPARGVVRGGGDDLAEHLHAEPVVAALERGNDLAPQGRGRLHHRAGIFLDLRLAADRAVCEIVALERLVGGKGEDGDQTGQRGRTGGTDERAHRRASLPETGVAHRSIHPAVRVEGKRVEFVTGWAEAAAGRRVADFAGTARGVKRPSSAIRRTEPHSCAQSGRSRAARGRPYLPPPASGKYSRRPPREHSPRPC